jgi:hypothetical protein
MRAPTTMPCICENSIRSSEFWLSLQSFIDKRKADGVKTSTINGAFAITRHVLNPGLGHFSVHHSGDQVKNTQDRLVVYNRVVQSMVDAQRGIHPQYVFVYVPKPRRPKPECMAEEREPRPVDRMNTTAWRNERESGGQVGEAHGCAWKNSRKSPTSTFLRRKFA